MADSGAERVRRARAHKKGDHSLCRRESCPDAAEVAVAAEAVASSGGLGMSVDVAIMDEAGAARTVGGIELAVAAFVEALPYVAPDPRALLAQIAVRLAQRVDETGALPAAVRELRVLLQQLTEVPNEPFGRVDEIRLRKAQRRLDAILASAA